MDRARGEDGFSLVELMVIVGIIAVLLAIAIPTFFGAQRRSHDRVAQSHVRDAHLAEAVYYTDKQEYTEDLTALKLIEPALQYVNQLGEMDLPGKTVYVDAYPAASNSNVLIGAKSASGSCFWLRTTSSSLPRFAETTDCEIPEDGEFRPDW